jgi:hypothetical protein
MLSTITVRSTLVESRSTRIETVGLLGCMVAHAPRRIAMRGIINLFMQASLREVTLEFACLKVASLLVCALSSLMLLALKIQGSGGVGAKDLASFFIREVQGIDLADGLKIAHRHGIIRSHYHAVCPDDLDQVL